MLVDTYKEVKGIELDWDKYKKPIYDDDVIEELKQYCQEYNVEFELMSKLIISVNNNKFITRKPVLKESFEKILKENWLHYNNVKEGIKDDNK